MASQKDTNNAVRHSALLESKVTPHILSEAKNNMGTLPGQPFTSTQIPVCLWFLAKNKTADAKRDFRDRSQQTNTGFAKV